MGLLSFFLEGSNNRVTESAPAGGEVSGMCRLGESGEMPSGAQERCRQDGRSSSLL